MNVFQEVKSGCAYLFRRFANSNHACFNKPLFFNALSFSVISSFSVGEMSMCNSSYTLRLFRCTTALLMYSSLSSTTIVEPLSALFITIRGLLLISSLRANLSFLVRLSCLSVFMFVCIQHFYSNSM